MKTFRVKVTGGRINDTLRQHIADYVTKYDGKIIEITIKEYKKQRSRSQNAYWWKVVIPAVRLWFLDLGIVFDAEECHEFIVRNVWKYTSVIVMPDGAPYERRLSSTTLSVSEWEQYMMITKAYFAEKGLILPDPH